MPEQKENCFIELRKTFVSELALQAVYNYVLYMWEVLQGHLDPFIAS